MSQDLFDPELFADFIAEAKEHLETIEPNLLELEKAPGNLALLNDIFRPMHSLKGASGFLGLNRINQLAHKSENILDELRKGSMVVTPEIMDVILASTDALRQMIDNLESSNSEGEVEIGHIMAQIDAIMAGEIPVQEQPGQAPASPSFPAAETAPASAAPLPETENFAAVHEMSDVPLSDPTAEAQPQDGAIAGVDGADGMSGKEWVATLPALPPYALTAFGESHLKDFIDESIEIIENLTNGLLELEENPTGQGELVNDLFRFFHNMKGNSGIIGYNDLNALTHEAETLLNNVRQGKIIPTHELIDLLLLVVDVMEALVHNIDVASGQASPFETGSVVKQLQNALAGGPIALPAELLTAQGREQADSGEPEHAHAGDDVTGAPVEVVTPTIIPVGSEGDDAEAFRVTVQQQIEIIHAALETLKKDGSHKDSIDALYRCLLAIKNACGFMGLADIKTYAERTAGIVDQGRSSGIDFDLMVDLLDQEVSIIQDMVRQALNDGKVPTDVSSATTKPASDEEDGDGTAVTSDKPEGTPTTTSTPIASAPAQAEVQNAAPADAKATTPATTAVPVSGGQSAEAASRPAQAKPATPMAQAAPARAAAPQTKGAAPAAEGHKSSSTIRVDHERLDHLMNLIGELIINRNRYTLIARSLEDSGDNIDISHVAQSLSETTYAMARISDDLQDTIMKVRMVPVSSVFSRFPRLVRDLSRKSGKEVDLVMEGEETELDKSVVEVIGDPLVHLIRNSVDHGIESEDVRLAAGKPAKGKVTLRAFHKGNSVAIEIEDDGKGIDPAKMRETAIRKGVITAEEAAQLDDREAVELIFAPGFSSADQITDALCVLLRRRVKTFLTARNGHRAGVG
ncbi:Hpt domain-containing protein, partial [Desulfovibrio sp.]|uniref:Hpt domain-containing protein n=1 Tax=Desulfovibrio sp. TaxID=885 RepID=UPI0025C0BD1E